MPDVNTKSHHNIFNTLKLYCVLDAGARYHSAGLSIRIVADRGACKSDFSSHSNGFLLCTATEPCYQKRTLMSSNFLLVAAVSCLDAAKHEEAICHVESSQITIFHV